MCMSGHQTSSKTLLFYSDKFLLDVCLDSPQISQGSSDPEPDDNVTIMDIHNKYLTKDYSVDEKCTSKINLDRNVKRCLFIVHKVRFCLIMCWIIHNC